MSLLVRPSVGLYEEWREAHEEWGDGLHEDGFGLLRVVLSCFVGNVPSVKTIERCGGVLDGIVTTSRGNVERYTIMA